MARPPQDPQIRINEILDTAKYLFSSKGYFGTTVSDIAKKMGVTQGMFYYYFKSKEEILEELLKRQTAILVSEVREMTYSSFLPSEKLGLLTGIIIKSIRAQGMELLDTVYHEKNLHIKNKLIQEVTGLLTPWGLKILEEGQRCGEFKVEHPPTSWSFILLVNEFLIDALYEKIADDLLELRVRLAESLIERVVGLPAGKIHILF